jgi:hypothetical protein
MLELCDLVKKAGIAYNQNKGKNKRFYIQKTRREQAICRAI